MGNRAVVCFGDPGERCPAVYLHWNGGPESVYTFLDVLNELGVRGPQNYDYMAARFVQLVGNFFGGTLSLGVSAAPRSITQQGLDGLDPGDNGIYWVTTAGVRRWVPVRDTDLRGVRELTFDEVKRERRLAAAHAYNKDGALRLAVLEKNQQFVRTPAEEAAEKDAVTVVSP